MALNDYSGGVPGGASILHLRPLPNNARYRRADCASGCSITAKGNADHLLRLLTEGLKSRLPVESVLALRKSSVSLPAAGEILDQLAAHTDLVVSAMAD